MMDDARTDYSTLGTSVVSPATKVQRAVHTLKFHTQVDVLSAALNELTVTLREDHGLYPHLLESLGKQRAHEDVLICMHNFPNCEELQIAGCELLILLIQLSEEISNCLFSKDTHQHVMRVLYNHVADHDVQVAALNLLRQFLKSVTVRKKILHEGSDALSHILSIMSAFPDSKAIQKTILQALRALLQDESGAQINFVENRDHRSILAAIKQHNCEEDIVLEACRLLHLLASEGTIFLTVLDGAIELMIADDIHLVMMSVARQFEAHEEIVMTAYGVLSILSYEEAVLMRIGCVALEQALLNCLQTYPANASIQDYCFLIFSNLLSYDDELPYIREQGSEDHWIKQIYNSMVGHRANADVQDVCCRVLSTLLELYPHLNDRLGDNEEKLQYPLPNLCFGVLLMHTTNEDVVMSVLNAIYWMSADHEPVQTQLVEKNVYIGVTHAMKLHRQHPGVQEAGCRALRGLCIFSQDNKEVIAWQSDLSDIMRPLLHFPDLLEVQIEAIAIIACLGDSELVRTKCMVEQTHQQILEAMERHGNSPLLHEVSLEALTILCAEDGATAALCEADAARRVLASMKIHCENAAIQRKGLILLQLLLDELDLSKDVDLSSDMAKVITAAMSQHSEHVGLQIEGCVAMLILAERGVLASVHLVESFAHAQLFFILENLSDESKLIDLASECLYVLGCERNLKSQMLQYACAQGMKRGIECLLQLGAEVNIGTGTDTPLCHACCHGDEYIVGLLLRQGVTDLETALQLSIRLEENGMAGRILNHLGYDQNAGSVSWNGLQLGDIRAEWFEPTFRSRSGFGRQVSAYSLEMAHRIKRNEENRMHRMKPDRSSKCDVTPRKGRKALRYTFRPKTTYGNPVEFVQKLEESCVDLTAHNEARKVTTASGKLDSMDSLKSRFLRFCKRRRSSLSGGGEDASMEKKSALIRSISTQKYLESDRDDVFKEELAEFSQCPDELREWKETTLTGSNVPFSSYDPRRSEEKIVFKQPHASPGEWQRKSPFQISRRRSDSMLTIYRMSRTGSVRSLRSLSQGSQQIDDNSSGSSVSSPLSSGPDTPDAFGQSTMGGGRPGRGLAARRSSTYRGSLRSLSGDATDATLWTIKDCPDVPGDKAEGSEGLSPGSTSNLNDDAFLEPPVRRCRSATIGDMTTHSSPSGRAITQLDLSNNQIKSMHGLLSTASPGLLNQFKLLERMDLSQNVLSALEESFFKFLTNIKYLNVSQNHLSYLPTTMLTCKQLTVINVSGNQITDLSLFSSRVAPSVKELDISMNLLEEFPLTLAKTTPRLEKLNLCGNRIGILPEEPLDLKFLRSLNLSYNYIRTLPEAFLSTVPVLETLILSGNELESLPEEEAAISLAKLHVVKLCHNQLATREPFYIPKFLLALQSLRVLDITHNQLAGLPDPSLWKVGSIREINVSHNSITKLCISQVQSWNNLERLTLAANNISELPREIGQLTSLTSLDISHNENITTLPDEMGKLNKLWELRFDGLKLDLDEGLLKGRTKDIIRYLHEKLKRSVEYYHMKMMVVGYGGRGKSTLLRSLLREKQPAKSPPTVGVVVKDWKFRGRSRKPGSGLVTYTLSAWDFAGQEEFYSTHQCFLSNRAVYLVIYNLARGHSEVEMLRPWLVNIQARAPNCPVIVIGTHLDQIPKDRRETVVSDMRCQINELCRGPGFPELHGLAEVNSTQDGAAIERLRVLIKEILDSYKIKGQHVMGQKIPESYVKLHELLSEEAKNVQCSLPIIKHVRVLKICRDAELDLDEDELQQAIRFLHESGSLLHYEDSALHLNDLYFIDPEWLCRMMAQVVTVREINPFISPQGILKKENIRHLFTGKRVGDRITYTFPPSLIPQYLMLLEKFEIALPQTEDELLIPSRLPPVRPPFANPLDTKPRGGGPPGESTIQRFYNFSYTPIGFWSRLITRLLVFVNHFLSETDLNHEHPNEVKMWREGLYSFYSKEAFFLVAAENAESSGASITVPATKQGCRLLGELVDHIDTLIEEWFPGLLELSPTGQSPIHILVPCPDCSDSTERHVFELDELIAQADLDNYVRCPVHDDHVNLSWLVPDVLLGDIEEKYLINDKDFVFVQSPEHALGEGTFGAVYRARYKNKAVAVKVYNRVGDCHPYKMMRQEATILRRLHHPSLISLVGLGIRPRVLLLELAPLGSLEGLLKAGRVTARPLQQRIAVQVAEGLEFLHNHHIIYRDMKPDNILIFSLSMAVAINAKISDYGISRLVTPIGMKMSEGTPGYRGPEVVKGEPYSVKADIYSFGITLYQLLTGGQHPFSELGFTSEMDDAVLKGRRPEVVTSRGAAPWPDMEELIDHCLLYVPDYRPTASQLLESLRSVELLILERAVPVSKDIGVDCMVVRAYGEDSLEAWVASEDKDSVQLSWISLTSRNPEPKGNILTGSRILAMETVNHSHVLLGTQAGTIRVYDAWQHCYKHTMPALSDSVLCLQHYSGYEDRDYVFVGLADGYLAIYSTKDLLNDSTKEPRILRLGKATEPVRVLYPEKRNRCLYAGVGSKVMALQVEPFIEVEWTLDTNTTGRVRDLISQLVVHGKHAHLAKKGEASLELWHITKGTRKKRLDLTRTLQSQDTSAQEADDRYARITSLALVGKSTLWIGTGGGAIVLVDSSTYQTILVTRRHTGAIRCLSWARIFNRRAMVVVGGLGFLHTGAANDKPDTDHGYLTVWDPDVRRSARNLAEDTKRREGLESVDARVGFDTDGVSCEETGTFVAPFHDAHLRMSKSSAYPSRTDLSKQPRRISLFSSGQRRLSRWSHNIKRKLST